MLQLRAALASSKKLELPDEITSDNDVEPIVESTAIGLLETENVEFPEARGDTDSPTANYSNAKQTSARSSSKHSFDSPGSASRPATAMSRLSATKTSPNLFLRSHSPNSTSSRPISATKIWKSTAPRTPERLLSEERLSFMRGWGEQPVGLTSYQILATSASTNAEYSPKLSRLATPEEIKLREPPLRPRSGRFRQKSPKQNEYDFEFESSSSSDGVDESDPVEATKQRIKDLVKSFDKVSQMGAGELGGLLVPVRRTMTPDLRGSKLASVNGNMLIKRPIFGIGDMTLRKLFSETMTVAVREDLESSLFVSEKNSSISASPPNDVMRKKSIKKHHSNSSPSSSNRVVSPNASNLMAKAQERVSKEREANASKNQSKLRDYSGSISLALDKPAMKIATGKRSSIFGNLVAGAAGISTDTAAASFLDIEMSEHATSIKEQYLLKCLEFHANPKSSFVQIISTFGKQHSHNFNFTGYGLSDSDFDAATIIFQNLTSLNSLHLQGNRLSTKSVSKFLDIVSKAKATSNLQHIDISGVNFDLVSVQTLLNLECLKSLPLIHFIANQCTMGDPASALVFEWLANGHCSTLTVLQLASNACASLFCRSVVRFSRRFSMLETFNLSWNHIRGQSAVNLVQDIPFFVNLTSLNLSWNGLGEAEVLDEFSRVLPKLKLKRLDLSYNRIDHESSSILCDAIRYTTTLQYLNLEGNPLRMIGSRNVISAIVQASKLADKYRQKVSSETDQLITIKVNITSCSVGVVSGQSFDSDVPFGEHNLNLSEPFARSKLRAVIRMVQQRVASIDEFLVDQRLKSVDAKLVQLNPSVDAMQLGNGFRGDVMVGIPSEGEAKILVSRYRRNKDGDVMDPTRFDIIKNILQGTRKEQRPEVLRMITSGNAFFKYTESVKALLELCEDNFERKILVGNVLNKVLAARPPPPPPPDVTKTDEDDESFGQAPSQAAIASALLPPEDVSNLIMEAKRSVPAYIRMYTVNNATGYYRINVSEPVEAEFLERLCSVQFECAQEPWIKEFKNRPGMLPINSSKLSTVTVPQRCFNRVFHNQVEQSVRINLIAPTEGILEIDFFDLRHPDPNTLVLPATVLYEVSKMKDPTLKVKAMRLLSNDYCFSLESCCALLSTLPQPSKEPGFDRRKRRRKSLSPKRRSSVVKARTARPVLNEDLVVIEIVVIMWSRVKERHGVGYLLRFLSARNQEIVTRRLGAHNIFDPITAVGFYELDLENFRHKYVVAELVRMATVEPGLNMVDCQYRDEDFEVPKGWTQDLPGRGIFCLHYCRSQQVQSQVLNGQKPSGSWPAPEPDCVALNSYPKGWELFQPSGISWVDGFKKERIRQKILSKFANASAVFRHIDTDGGGTIDRRELHAGFISVRIFLHPFESVALFRVIDEDESGDIDEAELSVFLEKMWSKPLVCPDWSQEYNFDSINQQVHLASQEECDEAFKASASWFSEEDICQFMSRKEENLGDPEEEPDE